MQFRGSQQSGGTDFEIIFFIDGKRYDLTCDTEGLLTLSEKVEKREEGCTSISWIQTAPTHEDVLMLLPQEEQWTWEKLMFAKEYWLRGHDVALRGYAKYELSQIEGVRRFNSFHSRSSAWGNFARSLLRRLERQIAQ